MNYFTTDLSHLKRDIVNFCYKMTVNCKKIERNLILDVVYGILASQDIKISNIARVLHEDSELDNTIERICIRLNNIVGKEIIKCNFRNYVKGLIPITDVLAIFDDSDIVKIYGKDFEDLDKVIDASDPKKQIKPGYHVCNACIISKNKRQPIEVFSKIYSTISKGFTSTNDVTKESIEEVIKIVGTNFTGVFDRGYDDEKLFRFLNNKGIKFVIRLKGNRNFLFKNKKKNVLEVAKSRKGKYKMIAMRSNNQDQELYVSYTRVNMTDKDKEEFTLVFVYGLGNDPLMLITNIKVQDGNDAIKIARMYIDRWKIEEVHRAEKTAYNYEDMRVRTLNQLNNLNFIFMITLGFICYQIEKIDSKLLSIEILIRSQSLKEDITVRISQFASGITEILKYSHNGINEFKKYNVKERKQLETIYEQLLIYDK